MNIEVEKGILRNVHIEFAMRYLIWYRTQTGVKSGSLYPLLPQHGCKGSSIPLFLGIAYCLRNLSLCTKVISLLPAKTNWKAITTKQIYQESKQ
jgi:hypothetical protein